MKGQSGHSTWYFSVTSQFSLYQTHVHCTFQLIDRGVLCGEINCKCPPSILITVLAFQRYRSFKLRNLRRRRRRHQSDSSSDMSEMSDESDLSEGQLVALTDCLCASVCLCPSSFLTIFLLEGLCLSS